MKFQQYYLHVLKGRLIFDCLLCLKDHDEVDVITDHLPEPKCGMDELVEKFQALDYLVGSNSEEEAEYWEMKAEVHFGL